MHLFISFIMRAFMALLRDNLFVDGLDNLVLSAENLSETAATTGVDLFHQYQDTSSVNETFFFDSHDVALIL